MILGDFGLHPNLLPVVTISGYCDVHLVSGVYSPCNDRKGSTICRVLNRCDIRVSNTNSSSEQVESSVKTILSCLVKGMEAEGQDIYSGGSVDRVNRRYVAAGTDTMQARTLT